VQDGHLDLGEVKEIEVEAEQVDRYKLVAGDVLLTEGGDFDKLGRGTVWRGEIPVCLHQNHVFAVRCDTERVQPDFLSALTASDYGKAYFLSAAKQTTNLASINSTQLKAFPTLLPPVPEQRKIATILSAVDEVIEKTEAVIESLQTLKKAVMQELLARGFPGRHTRFKQTEVGEIPDEWDVVPLRAVCERITDGTHQTVRPVSGGEVPFLYVSCVRDGRLLWSNAARIANSDYEQISRGREPRPGLVLYTAVGSYGHAAVPPSDRPYAFQRHIAYILTRQERVSPAFVALWLNSPRGRTWADLVAVGNAQKTVTLNSLKEAPIPLPSMEEQSGLSSAIDAVDARIYAEEDVRFAALAQKKALAGSLLTGELRVTPDGHAA